MTGTPGFALGAVSLSGEGYLQNKGMNVHIFWKTSSTIGLLIWIYCGSKAAINLPLSSSKPAKVLKIWVMNLQGIQCTLSIAFLLKIA